MDRAIGVLVRGSNRTDRLRAGRMAGVAVFAVVLLVGMAPPCLACSCIASTDEEHYQRADVVFTGKVTERHDPASGSPQRGSADPIHWTIDVDGTQKGKVADPVVVETSRDEASCGVTFVVGRRYQVFATNTGEYPHTDLCSGTRELNAGQGPYAPKASNPPATPAPVAPAPSATPQSTPSPTPTPTPTVSPTAEPTSTPTPSATNQAIDDFTTANTGNEGALIGLIAAIAALASSVFFWRRSHRL